MPDRDEPAIVPGPGGRHPRAQEVVLIRVLSVIALVAAVVFIALALGLAAQSWTSPVDAAAAGLMRQIRTGWLTIALWFVSLPGDPPFIVPMTVATSVLMALWGLRPGAVLMIVAMTAEAPIQWAVETAFHRARPPVAAALVRTPAPFSFPSGHAWAALLYAGILGFVLWRAFPKDWRTRAAIAAIAVAIAILTGASRIYLGVHWPSDVAAGWALSLCTLCLSCIAYVVIVDATGIPERVPPWGTRGARSAITVLATMVVASSLFFAARADPLKPGVASGSGVHPSYAYALAAARQDPRRPTCA